MNFDLNRQYILEDERVILRPLETADIDHLAHFAIEEPELWKFSLASVVGKAGLEQYLDNALSAWQKGSEYAFIVYDKGKKEYAGCTRFYDIQPAAGTMQLGYTWYGKKFQGTGLNKHCKYLLLNLAFETFEVERVEFRADATNEKSIAAMKSIGCTVEGIMRSHMPRPDGTRRDSIVLSILKDEWFAGVKAALFSKL